MTYKINKLRRLICHAILTTVTITGLIITAVPAQAETIQAEHIETSTDITRVAPSEVCEPDLYTLCMFTGTQYGGNRLKDSRKSGDASELPALYDNNIESVIYYGAYAMITYELPQYQGWTYRIPSGTRTEYLPLDTRNAISSYRFGYWNL